MRVAQLFCALILYMFSMAALCQQIDAPAPQRGSISGTVTDIENAVIPGATVTVDGLASNERRTLTTNETGWFELLDPAISYKVTISAKGFADWISPAVVLKPGQALELTDIKLKISVVETTVVALTVEQIATQQVKAEEKQRVLGILLPRHGHGEVAVDSRDFKPIYLQGRQWPFAVQLFRDWRQSDRGLPHQPLLSAEQSRTRIGLLQHSHQHRRPTRQRFGTGVRPAQVHHQCALAKLTD
jgi:hypothetical protein